MEVSWRSLCRLCGKTPNECFVDKFPDLRANVELFHLAQQFLYGTAIWEKNAVIPACFECEKFISEIYQFAQGAVRTRIMLVELRNKSFSNEPELVRHRDNLLTDVGGGGGDAAGTSATVTYELPFEEEVVEVVKSERKPEDEVEIILKNEEEWVEEHEIESIGDEDSETDTPEIREVVERKVNKPGRKRKGTLLCTDCDEIFSSELLLKRHYRKVHESSKIKMDPSLGPKPFICEECGKTWSTKGALKEHLIVHSEERAFHCSKCPKTFKNIQRLKIHEDIHNDTVYICTLCGLQLNTRRTLTMHMVVHSDKKNFKCEYCGNEYKRAKALKNHLIIHTGLRPYLCPFCDKTFANGSNCRTHKRKAHPELLAELEATKNKDDLKIKVLPSITELKTNLQLKASDSSGNMDNVTIMELKEEDI